MKKSLLLACALAVPSTFSVAPAAVHADPLIAAPIPVKPAAQYTADDIRNLGQGVVFPYDYLERVLATNVSTEGEVAYGKVKGNNDLEIFVRAVAAADLTQFPHWMIPADPQVAKSTPHLDRGPETAFWINAYNGLFLKAVADAYPVNSIGQIPGFDTAKTRIVAGKAYSFAELRRKIATDLDKRAIFALQSGTLDGPRTRAVAVRYSNLSNTLEQSISAYLLDPKSVGSFSVGTSGGSAQLSPWFQLVDEYFKGPGERRKWGGIRFILVNYYKSGSERSFFITNPDFEIKFTEGDGHLNDWTVH